MYSMYFVFSYFICPVYCSIDTNACQYVRIKKLLLLLLLLLLCTWSGQVINLYLAPREVSSVPHKGYPKLNNLPIVTWCNVVCLMATLDLIVLANNIQITCYT